jgi:hypothetical protein
MQKYAKIIAACLHHARASYVVYANAHSRINSLYHQKLATFFDLISLKAI